MDYHLGNLNRAIQSGKPIHNEAENDDETHFGIDIDSGATLGLMGDKMWNMQMFCLVMSIWLRWFALNVVGSSTSILDFKNNSVAYPIRASAWQCSRRKLQLLHKGLDGFKSLDSIDCREISQICSYWCVEMDVICGQLLVPFWEH